MIYSAPSQSIPQEQKKSINQKILSVIETGDLQGLTQQDIYEAYSPSGSIHGLKFKDFENFHSYTSAKKDATEGQYFTPHDTCETLINFLGITKDDTVCDLTCGHGAFFNFLPNLHNAYGCEVDSKAFRVGKFLYPFANISHCDVRNYKTDILFDFMVLNPPFNLSWDGISSQHYVCKKASEMMKPLGIMGLIVPKSFMNDEMSNKKDIEMMDENFSFLGQIELSKDEFKSMGVNGFETKMMFFQKNSQHVPSVSFYNEYDSYKTISQRLFHARNTKKSYRVKTMSEMKGNDTFVYKVRKYLYEFKTHKNLQYYSTKAKLLVDKYNNQKIPDGMTQKEWEKIRLTESKVLSIFKRVMKNAYNVEKEQIRLVKKNKSFEIKGYSKKSNHIISKKTKIKSLSIFELVVNKDVSETFRNVALSLSCDVKEFDNVISRKRNDYQLHNTEISKLPINKKYNTWLKRFTFVSKGKFCKLKDVQITDLNTVLQRNNTFLGWEMGTGKSVAMLVYIKFLQKYSNQKNIFITAPAIAIDLTLIKFLESNKIKLRVVKKASQLDNVKDGEVLIMTLGRLSNNATKVKEFVKKRSNKIAFIFDESDEISNYNSKRTKAVRNAFRRCSKKLLMTGTPTRNNINEYYPNFELMYNNSYNMMCLPKKIYKQDKKTKEIKGSENKRCDRPFDAYFGNSTFRSCFSPSKASVFGIEKKTQSIYNSDDLKKILDRSIITRTFEEVAGKKFKYNTSYIQPNVHERELQETIMNKFHQVCYNYFMSTGNSRKESYLRIIRMINLLIKSTSTPHLFSEWSGGNSLPTKYSKAFKMIYERADEKILVGCVGIESTQDYFEYIKEKFPTRKVFYVDGSLTFKKRGQIVEDFENTKNGIIVANQASLKSSVNIPSCDEVILVGLQWNFSKINQFVFRCIRLDSENFTNVNIICYSDSIELNVLNLLLNKERVNNFIKTTEIQEDEDVYDDYDVDANLLGSLIQKHIDEDGGMSLGWSESEIIKS